MEFQSGDLVKCKDGKTWYGVVLKREQHVPKVYPVYANKYRVKWANGCVSWSWGSGLRLVCRATKYLSCEEGNQI